jgi:S1-C subfamily serine protease
MSGVKFVSLYAVAAITAAAAAAVVAGIALASHSSTPIGTGVVAIRTTLGYEQGAAAGTGIVLTSNGRVLTNNHVIRGATSVRVIVPGTSRTYQATVVGYAVSEDVAVLQLKGASNLRAVTVGNSSTLRVGQSVTATGNAGGTGKLVSTKGTITGLGRTITASDEQNGAEELRGLIETDAALEPGDSGGPLFDGSHRVIGMNTAASVGFSFQGATSSDGYAIAINRAVALTKQIVAGRMTATVHVGGTPFLGIQVRDADGYGFGFGSAGGGLVAGIVSGSPASQAGLTPGDVITSIAGRAVTSSGDVLTALLTKTPGTTVQLTWVDDQTGTEQTATITLASGPAL